MSNVHIKVWGSEEWIVNADYCGKILNLSAGYRCSIHNHKLKDETFLLIEGLVLLETWQLKNEKLEDYRSKVLDKYDSYRIFPGTPHRFTGILNSKIIEFSTHHEDSDSYRYSSSEKVPELEFLKMYVDIMEVE